MDTREIDRDKISQTSVEILRLLDRSHLDVSSCMAVLVGLLVSGSMVIGLPKDVLLDSIGKLYESKKIPTTVQ